MWHKFQDGSSIGREGSEGGVIVLDEEHADGARITVERGGHAPWSITCGVYGSMVHTRLFTDRVEAMAEVDPMKRGLGAILSEDDDGRFSEFVARFP